jgi:hypothetical protein
MSDSLKTAAPAPSAAAATYDVPDIARLTKSSERHVRRYLGQIPGRIKGLGRLVRFSKAAVDAWLAGQTAGRR